MALVRLSLLEAQEELPPVCMVCGAEAHEVFRKKMSWNPSWVYILLLFGLLPFVFVALITTKRAVLQAPLCQEHKGHWRKRTLGLALSILGLMALVFIMASAENKPWQNALLLASVVLFLAWIVAAIVLSKTAIRPKLISDYEIVLLGVSPDFVDALVQKDTDQPYERPRQHSPLRGRRTSPHIQASKRPPDEGYQQ